jgi:hypothetical protein
MNGRILTNPELMDQRRIKFVLFDEETQSEISCQTAGDTDAPTMLEKIKGWQDVAIDGIWIPGEHGAKLMFRVDSILPKAEEKTDPSPL